MLYVGADRAKEAATFEHKYKGKQAELPDRGEHQLNKQEREAAEKEAVRFRREWETYAKQARNIGMAIAEAKLYELLTQSRYQGLLETVFKYKLADLVPAVRLQKELVEEEQAHGYVEVKGMVKPSELGTTKTDWKAVDITRLLLQKSQWGIERPCVLPTSRSMHFGTWICHEDRIVIATHGHFRPNLTAIYTPADTVITNDDAGRQTRMTQTAIVCASHISIHVGGEC